VVTVRINEKAKQKLLVDMRTGIIKQLYKNKQISSAQYQFLVNKHENAITAKA